MEQQYRAICDYHDGKFELCVGDLVTCEQTNRSWWGGTNLRTGLKGWYPAAYVEAVAVSPRYTAPVIPTVTAVPVPQPTWSSSFSTRQETPPAWAAPQQPSSSSPQRSSTDIVAGVGTWIKNGIANSSVGSGVQQQTTVQQCDTKVERSGSWFFGPSATKRSVVTTTTTTQPPRLAKRVGDAAVLSAVWGATTLHPKQMLAAAAVATGAYAVEGNQRSNAQQQKH